MKLLTTILFSLSAISAFGQTNLNGTYCSPRDFIGYCLTFKSDSLFDYSAWTCVSDENGHGTYKQGKSKLTLNFINEDNLKNSYLIKETDCSSMDSSKLTFLVLDNERVNIPEVNIWLTGFPNITKETYTDSNGNAAIILKNPRKEIEINLSYYGFKKFSFRMMVDNCKYIIVNLANAFNNVVANETKWEYEIIKVAPNELTLRQDNFDIRLSRREE